MEEGEGGKKEREKGGGGGEQTEGRRREGGIEREGRRNIERKKERGSGQRRQAPKSSTLKPGIKHSVLNRAFP